MLLEMLRNIEGFGGGHYTGIATIANGELHTCKVVGDSKTLVEQTAAADLPGTVGLIHGRPPLGGDREWAHPFVDSKSRFAFAANGHYGFFEDRGAADWNSLIREIHASGAILKSSVAPGGRLPARDEVHLSELQCCLIEREFEKGTPLVDAFKGTFLLRPGELAALMVGTPAPDQLLACRLNQPLMLGVASAETFVATTSMGFTDQSVDWIQPLPVLSTAVLRPGTIEIQPLLPSPGPVATDPPWTEGEERLRKLLQESPGGCTVQDGKDATASLWPSNAAPQKDFMVYEIYRKLFEAGSIRFEEHRVEGSGPGLDAPLLKAHWIRKN